MSTTPTSAVTARRSAGGRAWICAGGVAALLACDHSRAAAPGASEFGDHEALDASASGARADAPSAPDAMRAEPDAAEPDATRAETDAARAEPDAAEPDAPHETPLDAGPVAGRPRVNLVSPELWLPVEAAADPFDDRPEVLTCAPAAVMPELLSDERVLGVDTGGCSYLTIAQATRRDVAPGELLKVRLWHFELSAPEPAEAHAAVVIDGSSILEARVPIPQAGGVVAQQWRADRAIPAGALVYFHLHNHGANSWALLEVSAGP